MPSGLRLQKVKNTVILGDGPMNYSVHEIQLLAFVIQLTAHRFQISTHMYSDHFLIYYIPFYYL